MLTRSRQHLAPVALLALGLSAGLPTPAYAVPNFDLTVGDLLGVLLILLMGTVGIPTMIGLLVRWLMLRTGAVVRAGGLLPVFLACVGWFFGLILQACLTELLPDSWLRLGLGSLLVLATMMGAAVMGVYASAQTGNG